MHANVQLIYPDFIRAGNVLHSVVAAATWYSDIMEKFFLKKLCFKATIFISPNMAGLSFECVHTQKKMTKRAATQ
jgi:hypothetical protein